MHKLRQKKIFTLTAVLLLTLSLVAAPTAHAIESFGIGAVPANPRNDNKRSSSIFVHELDPGETIKDAVRVVNNTDIDKTISVYPVDSQLSSDGAFACAQAVDQKKEVGNWIKLEKELVELKPNTMEVIPFTISAPTSAGVGEHNGCIAIQDMKRNEANSNGIVLSFRSAIRVVVMVPGEVETSLRVEELKTSLSDKAVKVSPSLHNSGNVSLDTDITVKLKTILGMQSAAAGGKFPILRDTTGQFNFELKRPFWGGWYKVGGSAVYEVIQTTDKKNTVSEPLALPSKWLFIPPKPAALAIEVGVILMIAGTGIWYILYRRRHQNMHQTAMLYIVSEEDDIESIARNYHTNWKVLARLNQLKPPYQLTVGQKLKVPKPRGIPHTKPRK